MVYAYEAHADSMRLRLTVCLFLSHSSGEEHEVESKLSSCTQLSGNKILYVAYN